MDTKCTSFQLKSSDSLISSTRQRGPTGGFWGGDGPGHSYRIPWINSLSYSLVFLTYSSKCLLLLFFFFFFSLAGSQWFSFIFLLARLSTLEFISLLRSLLFSSFQRKNWFLKLFLLCCLVRFQRGHLQPTSFPPCPRVVRADGKLSREFRDQAFGGGSALAWGFTLSELHFPLSTICFVFFFVF